MGRKRIYNNSQVISIRISEEERQDINAIMASNRIHKVSDLMREAILLFKNNLTSEKQCRERTPCRHRANSYEKAA